MSANEADGGEKSWPASCRTVDCAASRNVCAEPCFPLSCYVPSPTANKLSTFSQRPANISALVLRNMPDGTKFVSSWEATSWETTREW